MFSSDFLRIFFSVQGPVEVRVEMRTSDSGCNSWEPFNKSKSYKVGADSGPPHQPDLQIKEEETLGAEFLRIICAIVNEFFF